MCELKKNDKTCKLPKPDTKSISNILRVKVKKRVQLNDVMKGLTESSNQIWSPDLWF